MAAGFNAVVQAGIGGSALGNLMLHERFFPRIERAARAKRGGPRFYLADNVDPRTTGRLESYRA